MNYHSNRQKSTKGKEQICQTREILRRNRNNMDNKYGLQKTPNNQLSANNMNNKPIRPSPFFSLFSLHPNYY